LAFKWSTKSLLRIDYFTLTDFVKMDMTRSI